MKRSLFPDTVAYIDCPSEGCNGTVTVEFQFDDLESGMEIRASGLTLLGDHCEDHATLTLRTVR